MSSLARAWPEAMPGDALRRWWRPQAAVLPWCVGALGLLALTIFDLGPALPFNDDWGMAWSARQLIEKHQLHIFPVQSALALVQSVISALVTLGNTDQRVLRLSALPFVVLGALSSYRIARQLGTNRLWSSIAGVTLLGSPLFLHNATTYMSDMPYVGLLLATADAGLRWIRGGDARLACVAWASLCPLQRQLGIVMPLAITIGLLAGRRRPARRRSDAIWLAALWVAVGAAALAPVLSGVAPPTQANRVSNILHLSAAHQALPLAYLPSMIGLFLIPFAAAILFAVKPAGSGSPTTGDRAVTFALRLVVAAGLADFVIGLAHLGWGFYPGNSWMPYGFTLSIGGSKTSPFPLPVFLLVEVLTVATLIVLFLRRHDLWLPRRLRAEHLFLIALSTSQFAPLLLLQTSLFDRYYLPVLAPAIPLVASMTGALTRPRLAAGWAIGTLLLGQGLYVVGEQDFEAWHVAVHQAALTAFAEVGASAVDAGYEENAMAVEVPEYERSGVILGGLARNAKDVDYAVTGPANPAIRLRYARLGDPRPGVDYHSLTASGRIVLVRP